MAHSQKPARAHRNETHNLLVFVTSLICIVVSPFVIGHSDNSAASCSQHNHFIVRTFTSTRMKRPERTHSRFIVSQCVRERQLRGKGVCQSLLLDAPSPVTQSEQQTSSLLQRGFTSAFDTRRTGAHSGHSQERGCSRRGTPKAARDWPQLMRSG